MPISTYLRQFSRLCFLFCFTLDPTTLTAQSTPEKPAVAERAVSIKPVDRSVKQLEEKSVIQHNTINVEATEGVSGIRLYGFYLEPQERLEVRIKSEETALVMSFLDTVKLSPMTRAVRAANTPPYMSRQSQIRIKNPADTPQRVVLQVGGPVNHAYTLTIEYIAAKN